MYLSTETRPDGIHCYFAGCTSKQSIHNDDRFCVITRQGNYWKLSGLLGNMASRAGQVFFSVKAAEYYALALAIEYLEGATIALEELNRELNRD